MYTLGINAAFHDSAACLVQDGQVVAAAEEERFTRIKHAKRPLPFTAWELPFAAMDYCLAAGGIQLADVDHVAYAFDPSAMAMRPAGPTLPLPLEPAAEGTTGDWATPWEPLFYAYVVNAPRQLADGAPHPLAARFAERGRYQWHYVEHHLAHEASAFLASPYASAAVLTLDGRGERATTTLGHWHDGRYRRLRQIDMPASLGLLYEEATDYLGFLRSSDEYKVMALASYGKPRYIEDFRNLLSVGPDATLVRHPGSLAEIFGPPRVRGEALAERHFDIAASLQAHLEESALRLAGWIARETGERRLLLAGGVALNCVMNARLRDAGLFDGVWAQPAAGDAGTALGAALWIDHQQRRRPDPPWVMHHAYLGPAATDAEIEAVLHWAHLPYRRLFDVSEQTAALLAAGKIVGWYQDRMEFGPRALGARSILASPLDPAMQARLNELKDREDFRPVAPAILEEALPDWVEDADANAGTSPFMIFVYRVKAGQAGRIPAAVHVDGTARVQTVSPRWNPRFHLLLQAFQRLTGVPVLINTSFNVRGEPIVCSPRDAITAFYATPIDALVIGPFLLEKTP